MSGDSSVVIRTLRGRHPKSRFKLPEAPFEPTDGFDQFGKPRDGDIDTPSLADWERRRPKHLNPGGDIAGNSGLGPDLHPIPDSHVIRHTDLTRQHRAIPNAG